MKKYFFIGIGGIGMSGLAKILLERGEKVSGSDPATNKQTDELKALGARIEHEHKAENITKDFDIVVFTSAIPKDNPEIAKAKELGLKIIERAELLNEIINTNQVSIAVTGTHGKTTTSSMIASILEEAGEDPTAVIGAEVKSISGNAKSGNGKYSVAEVCEYQRAFLDIYPQAAVITNVEEDHLDCYKDLEDIIGAFAEFVGHIPKEGFLVVNGDDENTLKVIIDYKGKLITFGIDGNFDYVATGIKTSENFTTYTIYKDQTIVGEIKLRIPGKHNILNSLSAAATALELGIDFEYIKKSLGEFCGAERRFQILGTKDGVTYIDDYAHHPTEIRATLEGSRKFYPSNRIIAVFQPHQHSRTKFLLDDFSTSFSDADIVILPEIYAVRDTEEDKASVSSNDLVEKINALGKKAYYFKNFEDTKVFLEGLIKEGDIVMTIGAGPINKIAHDILKSAKKANVLDK